MTSAGGRLIGAIPARRVDIRFISRRRCFMRILRYDFVAEISVVRIEIPSSASKRRFRITFCTPRQKTVWCPWFEFSFELPWVPWFPSALPCRHLSFVSLKWQQTTLKEKTYTLVVTFTGNYASKSKTRDSRENSPLFTVIFFCLRQQTGNILQPRETHMALDINYPSVLQRSTFNARRPISNIQQWLSCAY